MNASTEDRQREVDAGEARSQDNSAEVSAPLEAERWSHAMVTLVDGELLDLRVSRDAADPFMSECPPWCRETGHTVNMHADDRWHFGIRYGVPVHSLRAKPDDLDTYVIGAAIVYLRQHNQAAAPLVWVGQGESNTGFELTVGEARDLARLLQRVVGEASSDTNRHIDVSPSDMSPSYIARVAAQVSIIMAERAPLTVDELGVIAGVLNCNASELLASHLEATQ